MSSTPPKKPAVPRGQTAGRPGWADGLRQLYDSVVEEPLPSNFKDLLAQLDKSSESKPPKGGSKPQ